MSKVIYPRPCAQDKTGECGLFNGPRTLGAHYREVHGLKPRSKYVPKAERNAVVKADPPPKPPERKLHADDIVLPVMLKLYNGKGIPVEKLEAIFTWRDDTSEMLSKVQQ